MTVKNQRVSWSLFAMVITQPIERARLGPKPKPIIEYPIPNKTRWRDPERFCDALDLHMTRHGDTPWSLCKAIILPGEGYTPGILRGWRLGRHLPVQERSLKILA